MARPLQFVLQQLPHGTGARRHVQEHQRHPFPFVAAQVHLPEASRVNTSCHLGPHSSTFPRKRRDVRSVDDHGVSAETRAVAGSERVPIAYSVFIRSESEPSRASEHPKRTRPAAPPSPVFQCAACVLHPQREQIQCEEKSRETPLLYRRRPASRGCPTPRPPTSTKAHAAPASTLRYLHACTGRGSPSDGAGRPRAAPGRRHRVYPRP